MKFIQKIFIAVFFSIANFVLACEACKLQQPKITQSFTHGTGPESQWDWVIVAVVALVALYTLIFSLKYLIQPGEKEKEHIKHSILD